MRKLLILPALLAASAALAQEGAGAGAAAAPMPGQDGLNSAMFWFGITVIAMMISLYAVHRSVFRKR